MPRSSQAITPSDLEEAERIFREDSKPYDRVRFCYDSGIDKWCLHDLKGDTRIAERTTNTNEWVRV